MYYEEALKKAEILKKKGSAIVLAIESSCDETAAAVMRGFDVLGARINSQIALHEKYGGVVPEIASRDHVRNMDIVIEGALSDAGLSLDDVEAVAVTYGPGLVGALLCGVSYAKALAFAKNIPLFAINHIEGHICANYIAHRDLRPPYVCLVASGGHSHIVLVEDHGRYRLIGKTRDDAAGEAFDKAARILGLGYPGGPKLDALAKTGDPNNFPRLPRPKTEGFDYSFSGLKTAFLQTCARLEKQGGYEKTDAAAAFQQAVSEQLTRKAVDAAISLNAKTLAVSGGVAANSGLRAALERETFARGIRFFMPPTRLCTDNAEMIGAAAHIAMLNSPPADMRLNAEPSLRLKLLEM